MENNFLCLIKTRRSVRAYKSEPVSSEILNAILEAETYAPTGGGHQSPIIIAITDPKYRHEIADLNAEVMGCSTDPYYGAPVVVLVLADGSADTFIEDGSCRNPYAASARSHWVIRLKNQVSPQPGNKTTDGNAANKYDFFIYSKRLKGLIRRLLNGPPARRR